MIEIDVKIRGIGDGLLMHSPRSLYEPKKQLKTKGEEDDFNAMAKMAAYKMEDGTLYIPSEAILGSMRNASKYRKLKRGMPALRQIISGIVTIEPEQISLGTKQYEVDIRPFTMKTGERKLTGRPLLKEWEASFKMKYNPMWFPLPPKDLKEILEIAGQVVGILSFRPEHAGPFGRFKIESWEVKEI